MSRTWTIKQYPSGHSLQERNSKFGMGVDHRITSAKLEGPWTPKGKTDAWKRYKAARKRQDLATAADSPPNH